MVRDPGLARVHVGAAELLRCHVLAGRRLHERRPADEDRPGPTDDHRLVAHRRHVRAAGGARAHHDRDLRDPLRRHPRLVEEDPAEVLAVGKDLRLQRQKRPARVDEIEARQLVLLRHLLRTQVLLHRQRKVRTTFHRRVVRDDHTLAALDHTDPGHDPGARRLPVVDLPGSERVQLQERSPRIDEPVDPLARQQLPARAMTFHRPLTAPGGHQRRTRAQLLEQGIQPCSPAGEVLRLLDPARELRHGRSLTACHDSGFR